MPRNLTTQHTRMEATKKTLQNCKETDQNSYKIQVPTSKGIQEIMHRWEVSRDYEYALQLNVQNGNIKWRDAIDLEIEQIKEYQVFKDHVKAVYGKNKVINTPKSINKLE